jgi:hypothetical protein
LVNNTAIHLETEKKVASSFFLFSDASFLLYSDRIYPFSTDTCQNIDPQLRRRGVHRGDAVTMCLIMKKITLKLLQPIQQLGWHELRLRVHIERLRPTGRCILTFSSFADLFNVEAFLDEGSIPYSTAASTAIAYWILGLQLS